MIHPVPTLLPAAPPKSCFDLVLKKLGQPPLSWSLNSDGDTFNSENLHLFKISVHSDVDDYILKRR